jgi:hypothetical protein
MVEWNLSSQKGASYKKPSSFLFTLLCWLSTTGRVRPTTANEIHRPPSSCSLPTPAKSFLPQRDLVLHMSTTPRNGPHSVSGTPHAHRHFVSCLPHPTFSLNAIVPLRSVLPFPVCCHHAGSPLVLTRQHRHCVFALTLCKSSSNLL